MLKSFFIAPILLLGLAALSPLLKAQTLVERHEKIRRALDQRNYSAVFQELQSLQKFDSKIFELNNYDYLLARTAENRRDLATAIASYQNVLKRNSVLREYALWRLAQIMRSSGNLMLERFYLQQLLLLASEHRLLSEAAHLRLAESFYESGDYAATIQTLKFSANNQTENQKATANEQKVADPKLKEQKLKESKQSAQTRGKLVLLGNAFLRNNQKPEAREVFAQLINNLPNPVAPDDFALIAVRGLDELDSSSAEDFGKRAPALADDEHRRRAFIYQFNRDFANARLHLQAIVNNSPSSPNRPEALLQLGRIASLEEKYSEAVTFFERVQGEYPNHPAARDALNFKAGAYSRGGNLDEAITHYRTYIARYIENASAENELPENSERPYLNMIDALRDKGRDADALEWIRITREQFENELPAAQALFSQARIHLAQKDWNSSLRDLIELEKAPDFGGTRVAGGTNLTELRFLKAFCLEQLERYEEAFNEYLNIADGRHEYYGGRATARLKSLAQNEATKNLIQARADLLRATAKQALNLKDWEGARQAAQNALRLTDAADARSELLDVARTAYAALPAYKLFLPTEPLLLGRQKVLEKAATTVNHNQSAKIADELLFLGLYDEAAPELEAAWRSVQTKQIQNLEKDARGKKDEKQNFTLAIFYKRGDLADRAVAYAESLWQSVPADYLIELAPREAIELLYPTPYEAALLEQTPERNVDPRFLLAIMRQESRFRASAKSIAAARGLMQFIPSTAARIARELNQESFAPNDLYDPPIAILFGSQYVFDLFQQFPDQAPAVAASYNGGEANMTRWLVRSRSVDADRYVPEIQFSQSKDYVYKVMANYRVYETLYDNRLQRK